MECPCGVGTGPTLGGSAQVPKNGAAMDLRPLGFGELFDRAITLYIKNFKAFFAIVLIVLVPYAFAQYWIDLNQASQLAAIPWLIQHPGAQPPPAMLAPQQPGIIAAILAIAVIFYAFWIVTVAAVSVGVARLYRGRPVEFSACYRVALARWPSLLGVLLCEIVLLVFWYAMVLVVTIAAFLIAALVSKTSVVVGVIAFIVAIVVVIAAVATALPVFMAMTCAMFAVPIEQVGPMGAIGKGFARVFSGGEFWRATLFALAATAAALAGSMIVGVVSTIFLFVHWIAAAVILSTLGNAVVQPFSIVLLAVYYFDLRIRHEGFDLEAELERVAASPA